MSLVSMLQALVSADVRLVVVGGVAARLLGSVRQTDDLDICYDAEPANVSRLTALLATWNAYPRGWEFGLPFFMDARTLRTTPTITLRTKEGDIDLLHRVEPIGDYAACKAVSFDEEAFGARIPTLTLGPLIRAKRYANRPKDHLALPELEAMAVKRGEWPPGSGS